MMAFYTDTHTGSFLDGLRRFFRDLGNSFDLAASANARVAHMERLNAKSDEELAELGLRREDIARYVFRDILYM